MQKAAKALRAAKTVVVASHVNPDGDTIGCLLALGHGLLQMSKRVILVSPDGMPARFQFLPGSNLVLTGTKVKADVAVAVDCGSGSQLGPFYSVFGAAKTTIQIDHHDFGEGFSKLLVVDTEAAAVGEIIYDLLKLLKVPVTPAIATCLLTSIIVDTGSFRFSNVRSRTLRICADLLDKGVDMKYLIEEAYWKRSLATSRLEAVGTMNMKFEQNGKVVWTVVRQADFKRQNGGIADADGVADSLRSIDGVKIAAVIRETSSGRYRISLRSGVGINVAIVAKEFGGGGHHYAAGCSLAAGSVHIKQLIRRLCEIV